MMRPALVSCQLPSVGVLLAQNTPQSVLVGIANLLEDGSGRLGSGRLAAVHGEESKLVLYDIGDGLCVSGTTGSAAPYCVMYSGKLVGYAVRNVCAGGCAGVGSCNQGLAKDVGSSLLGAN